MGAKPAEPVVAAWGSLPNVERSSSRGGRILFLNDLDLVRLWTIQLPMTMVWLFCVLLDIASFGLDLSKFKSIYLQQLVNNDGR